MDAKGIYETADAFVKEMTTETPEQAKQADFVRYRLIIIKQGVMIRELARLVEQLEKK